MALVLFRFPFVGPVARQEHIRRWSLGVLERLGIALEVAGTPAAGASLIAANHVSWLDVMAIHAIVPQARFVAKADVKGWPVVSRLVGAAQTLYLERERKRDALRVVGLIAGVLESGGTVAVFPEGTTSAGHGLLPFHANMLQAAVATGTPAQPVALRYSDSSGPVSAALEFIGQTTLLESLWRSACGDGVVARLIFLPAVPTAGVDRRQLAERLRNDIAGALGIAPAASTAATACFSRRGPEPRLPPRPSRRRRHRPRSSCGGGGGRRRARRPGECRWAR